MLREHVVSIGRLGIFVKLIDFIDSVDFGYGGNFSSNLSQKLSDGGETCYSKYSQNGSKRFQFFRCVPVATAYDGAHAALLPPVFPQAPGERIMRESIEPVPLSILDQEALPQPARRRILAGFVGAYAATLVPWALAQPVRDGPHADFLALSALIVGRQALDASMAARIRAALTADTPGFELAAGALLKLINDRKIDPRGLQKTLDDEKSPLAPLPRQIATAWFLGVIGSGPKARVIAYEHALNAQIVADVLKPPTYAYGPHGSWSRKPL